MSTVSHLGITTIGLGRGGQLSVDQSRSRQEKAWPVWTWPCSIQPQYHEELPYPEAPDLTFGITNRDVRLEVPPGGAAGRPITFPSAPNTPFPGRSP